MKTKFILFHPCRILGGTEILLSDTSILYLKNNNVMLYLVDFIDGATYRILKENDIDFKFVDYNNKETWLPLLDGSIIFSTSRNLLGLFYDLIKVGSVAKFKLVLWVLHPKDLYCRFAPGLGKLQKIFGYKGTSFLLRYYPGYKYYKNLLLELNKSGNLYFMDQQTLAETELMLSVSFSIKEPLFFPAKDCNEVGFAEYDNVLFRNIAVVSRLDDMKIPSIIKLFKDISKNKKNKKIFVVGYGEGKIVLENEAIKLNIDVVFVGRMDRKDLRNFLLNENISVLYAMGMSIFEGISIGIPTVVLRPSETVILRDNVYHLFGGGGQILFGEFYEFPSNINYKNFEEIDKEIEDNWLSLSLESHEIYKKFFLEDAFYKKFHNIVHESKEISFSDTIFKSKDIYLIRYLFDIVQKLRGNSYDY